MDPEDQDEREEQEQPKDEGEAQRGRPFGTGAKPIGDGSDNEES
ncbi:hypothetical protein Mesil_1256 [Allomeiothermus silvanus DSM 9946]|uniref:Uncharacterized protein n=1 Tax=Allomeiothermus silvanus (strain ATCC 700542 / DSM 9946 / NBRC 106475 / NCIMB 13440 / VI-R2) TaxID=526227 RepID=D7BE01_ALLS1|nr:hypothetical protein [Allomeiothermus silvanus]ADH63152.1 hypothetical protein Mesil_1256 [Allomeiothermus silvanus DSM 9946]